MKPLTLLLGLIAVLAAATKTPVIETAATATTANVAQAVITFADLAEGEELFMRLVRSGCFHHQAYEFTFHRGETFTVEITEIEERRPHPDNAYERVGSRRIGDIALTGAEIRKLDQMLKYYRCARKASSTNSCEVWITRRKEGKTSVTEYLSDCSTTEANGESVGSLMDLIGLARVRQDFPNLEWIYRP